MDLNHRQRKTNQRTNQRQIFCWEEQKPEARKQVLKNRIWRKRRLCVTWESGPGKRMGRFLFKMRKNYKVTRIGEQRVDHCVKEWGPCHWSYSYRYCLVSFQVCCKWQSYPESKIRLMSCKFPFNSNLFNSTLGFFQNEVSQGQKACAMLSISWFNLIKNSDL